MFEELLDREKDWTAGMTREEEGEFEYGHIIRLSETMKLKEKNKLACKVRAFFKQRFGRTGKY